MLLNKQTIKIQEELASYCRDGKLRDIPGANSERLPHYRRLVFNVMFGLMEQAFPIAHSKLSTPEFKTLVAAFMEEHEAKSPQVWRVPGEFVDYVCRTDLPVLEEHPYLCDLLLMEWMEILVYNREDRTAEHYSENMAWGDRPIVLNPDSEIINLKYPVFKRNWEGFGSGKNYQLLLFRNRHSLKVHFMELSVLHLKLIELWKQSISYSKSVQRAIEAFDLENNDENRSYVNAFGKRLYDEGFILGTKS
ncbi:MAG: putative DNA-binding domain-containing protein [Vicingaceae bacterium]